MGPALSVLDSATAIEDAAVLKALSICQEGAESIQKPRGRQSHVENDSLTARPSPSAGATPANDLIFKEDDPPTPKAKAPVAGPKIGDVRQEISDAALAIIRDPKVFISPGALQRFVDTQLLLSKPATIPEAFHLYAHKDAPNPGTSPVTLRAVRPARASAAIPLDLATAALGAALRANAMDLALAIMEQSTGASAFRRRKAIQWALPPALGLAAAPLGFWEVADWAAAWQNTMPAAEARGYWFVGLTVWFGLLAGFGGLSVVTINRRIDRVSWQPGTLFHERWAREEERLMIERIAAHWGFVERQRRGEEVGEQWDALRDYCGMRDMVLDQPSQMDDME